jgi:hypothetical protein
MRRWKLFVVDPDDKKNSLLDIKNFLSTPEKPVSTAEFTEFWDSCSESEKTEIRKAQLAAK